MNHPDQDRPVLGSSATNTHFFDGKIQSMSSFVKEDIDRVHTIPLRQKVDMFNRLTPILNSYNCTTENTRRCFNAIVESAIASCGEENITNRNYDPVNKLHADDLLYMLGEKIVSVVNDGDTEVEGTECDGVGNSEDHLALLVSQLDEMATGLCPQGRTTRLLQIIVMLRDDLTPTSK